MRTRTGTVSAADLPAVKMPAIVLPGTALTVPALSITDPAGGSAGPPPTAARPRVGLCLLLVAGLAALTIRAVMAPGLAGSATAAPMPLPPAVGSCVVLDGASVSVVQCAEPHSGEVVMSWSAGVDPADAVAPEADSRVTFSVVRSLPSGSDRGCAGWTQQYTGWTRYLAEHRNDLWFPPEPLAVGRMLAAPAGAGLPDRHWVACVALTADPLYIGTIRGVAQDYEADRPDAVAVCVTTQHAKVAFPQCAQAHTTELLASVALTQQMMMSHTVAVDHTSVQVHQLCLKMATQLTGNRDPTYGGQLEVVTESVWQQTPQASVAGVPSWVIPDCLIRVVGSGELVGSVIGLGDSPLPVRR